MFFGKKKKEAAASEAAKATSPSGPAGSTGSTASLVESHHFKATLVRGVVVGEVMCDQVTEREAKFLLDEIAQATEHGGSAKVVVDMKNVANLASAGIGTLVQTHKRLKGNGGGLAIFGLNDDLDQVMKLTRMDKLFCIAATREDAIANLS
ncbi:MAG: STAS domain-containing protein [Planctomycetota bacterium]